MSNVFLMGADTVAEALPSASDGINTAFYNGWNQFLVPETQLFLKMKLWIGHTISVFFTDIANNMYEAWTNVWSLVDFSRVFQSSGILTDDAMLQVTALMFMLAFLALAIGMMGQMIMFSLTGGAKGRDWPKGIIISLLLFITVPAIMPKALGLAESFGGSVNSSSQSTPMAQLWKSNSLSLIKLGEAGFDEIDPSTITTSYSALPAQPTDGYFRNTIYQKTTIDDNVMDPLKDSENGKTVLENKAGLNDSEEKSALDGGGWFSGKTFAEAYPAVKTNFIAISIGALVYSFALFFAIIEFITHIYKNAYYSLSLVYFSWRDLSGKKGLEIAKMLEGSILGMALMPIGVNLYLAWNTFAFEIIGTQLNLSFWPATILYIAVLIGGFKALMTGFSMIDEWTGMPSGQGQMATAVTQNPISRAATHGAAAGAGAIGGAALSKTKSAANSIAKAKISSKPKSSLSAGKKSQSGKNPSTTKGLDQKSASQNLDKSNASTGDSKKNEGSASNLDRKQNSPTQNSQNNEKTDSGKKQNTPSGKSPQLDGKSKQTTGTTSPKYGFSSGNNSTHNGLSNNGGNPVSAANSGNNSSKSNGTQQPTGFKNAQKPKIPNAVRGNSNSTGSKPRTPTEITKKNDQSLNSPARNKSSVGDQNSVSRNESNQDMNLNDISSLEASMPQDLSYQNETNMPPSYEAYDARQDIEFMEMTQQPEYDFNNYGQDYTNREKQWYDKHSEQ